MIILIAQIWVTLNMNIMVFESSHNLKLHLKTLPAVEKAEDIKLFT